MCLVCGKIEFLEEDKIVYKVFKKTYDDKLFTAYQDKEYELSDNVIHDSLDFVKCDDEFSFDKLKLNGHEFLGQKSDVNCYHVNGGMFHSFARYEDAIRVAKNKETYDCYEHVVVKCIIPKDSKLVMYGRFNSFFGRFDSYASSEIIFKEIVDKSPIHIEEE